MGRIVRQEDCGFGQRTSPNGWLANSPCCALFLLGVAAVLHEAASHCGKGNDTAIRIQGNKRVLALFCQECDSLQPLGGGATESRLMS